MQEVRLKKSRGEEGKGKSAAAVEKGKTRKELKGEWKYSPAAP